MIDGDNKPLTAEEARELHKNTIQLEKYCVENYLLDRRILGLYKEQEWDVSLTSFVNSINVRASPAIKPVHIALQNGTPLTEMLDYVDGSEIFKKLAESEGKKDTKYDFMKELVSLLPANSIFVDYFNELSFLKG